ncbi:endo-1,4-beta-xylanase [Paenibacillus physcomitrellae]|uniref:Beta-xylanase n=1 Tax=Paenibacillus physcomitrellae TaxID=1619311 RepID=A0ABQ1FKZ5_9BACL|nr:endo-1,4-beta-xylanase [Paenibacillus physcomitrellae]GGA19503.1 hypothetical protein GCM10010917_00160 [Paenibacillus physcomitrellae]
MLIGFKKGISLVLAAALLVPLGWRAPLTQAAEAPDIPVLLYHVISDNPQGEYQFSTDQFEQQMKYLHDNGYTTLTADQYVDIVADGQAAPDHPILLTFDDATPDFISNALPILKKYDFNSVQFVVSDWIGGGYSMTKAQLQELANESSVSLENHSKTHNNDISQGGVWTNQITKDQALDEVEAASTFLQDITGKPSVLFAYPYGAYNQEAKDALKDSGIQVGFKAGPGDEGPYAMGRILIKNGDTLSTFASAIGGPAPADSEEPANPEAPGGTVLLNQSFEDGQTGGWAKLSWGSNGETSVVSGLASEGSKSLKFSNRADEKAIPALVLTDILKSEHQYDISLKVRLGSGSGQFHLGSKIDSTLLTNQYPWIVGNQTVTDTGWTTFAAKAYEIPADTKEVIIWVEPSENTLTSDIYIDEVVITDVTSGQSDPGEVDQTGIKADFETGTQNFIPRNNRETVELTTEDNHTLEGGQSLKVTTKGQYDGALVNAAGKMAKNNQYELSAWVKMAPGQNPTRLRISVQSGDSTFTNVSENATVTDRDWVQLSGKYTLAVTPTVLNAYIETADNDNGDRTFFLDDFQLTYLGPVNAPPPVQQDIPSLQEVYKDDFLIGNAVSSTDFEGQRLELLKKHFNVVTAENAMKPDQVYNTNKQFDFTAADALVSQITAAGLKLHGHVLVWHQQTPEWLNTGEDGKPLTREQALANMRSHIETVIEHFGNKVISWDVVNEAMNDNPSDPTNWKAALRSSPWKAAIGDDYVEQAFLIAREVLDSHPDWDIKLYYNDYNEDNQNKATAIASMVQELNNKYASEHDGKLLIDGIGMQGHYNLNTRSENVEASLEKFIQLGVEVCISELDVTAGSDSKLTDKQANAQGYLYAQLMNIFKEHADHIFRVTWWGLNDSSSWRASQNPLLFDQNLQAKKAYYGVADPDKYMTEYTPDTEEAREAAASYGTPQIDGIVDDVWNQAAEIPVNRFQSAWQGASGVAKALWDDQNLYVLIQVADTQLDKTSANAWEQDSIEVFLDQNNAKTTSYQEDDGQYRVNFENETSFNPENIGKDFQSAAQVSGTNYTVEVKIPLKHVTPANDMKLGFDVQINDAKDGARQSAAAWNDLTGQGYQDTSVYGILSLMGKPAGGGNGGGDNGNGNGGHSGGGSTGGSGGNSANNQPVVPGNGAVTTPLQVTLEGGLAKAALTADLLKQKLEQTASAADGVKTIVFEIPKQTGAQSYEIQWPVQGLQGQDNYKLLLKTEFAAVTLPSSMLGSAAENAEQASVRMTKASPDNLNEAAHEQIGNRPLIDLSFALDGRVVPWNNPLTPITVNIPYTPAPEELDHPDQLVVLYVDEHGKATPVPSSRYDAADQGLEFKTTHFSIYGVAAVPNTFGDLQNVPWAQQAIGALYARGIAEGTSADRFSPSSRITRADFISLLMNTLELKGTGSSAAVFYDVQSTAEYYGELAAAKELGIVTGNEDQLFLPNQPISRQDAMVMASRALKTAGRTTEDRSSLEVFADQASISDYAKDSVSAMVGSGLVQGKGGSRIAPLDSLTRAEAAVILYRIWSK